MTHNEINSCPTCATDKYGTVIDKKARYCLEGSECDGGAIWHLKTSSVQIFKRSEQNRNGTSNSRSKNSLYCKVVSKPGPIATRICKKVTDEFKRNRLPIFGGFSPKWQGAALGKRISIEIFGLNTAMID